MTTRLRSPRPSALRQAGEGKGAGAAAIQSPPADPRGPAPAVPSSQRPLRSWSATPALLVSRATQSNSARLQDFVMARARGLLCLWLGCFCLNLALGQRPNLNLPGLRGVAPSDRTTGGGPSPDLRPHDKVSEHMLWLYDRYSGSSRVQATRTLGSQLSGPQPLRGGNTVRSFRAAAAGEWGGEGAYSSSGCRGQPLPPCHSAVAHGTQ